MPIPIIPHHNLLKDKAGSSTIEEKEAEKVE
jgi:hypothetical protein